MNLFLHHSPFPNDLSAEILSRLPVKSLVRFRCVSKSWQAFIEDPHFARLHLTRFNNNRLESHLFVIQGNHPKEECFIRCSNTFGITTRLGSLRNILQSIDVEQWEVLSSIDGLFILNNGSIRGTPELTLWNPSTRKALILPPAPEIPNEMLCVAFGLGFDPFVKDYKYVTLALNVVAKVVHLVAVYSLGINSWKTIESRWEPFIFPNALRSFCIRGVLYTLARDSHSSPLELFSFDLSSEVFASARLPGEFDRRLNRLALAIIDDGCSLGLVEFSIDEGSIWVMDNLGADLESLIWTRRYTFSTMVYQRDIRSGASKFLHLNMNGKMLFKWRSKLASYNLETGGERIIFNKISLDGSVNTWPYIETLVLH